jgi:hypothetical protein
MIAARLAGVGSSGYDRILERPVMNRRARPVPGSDTYENCFNLIEKAITSMLVAIFDKYHVSGFHMH